MIVEKRDDDLAVRLSAEVIDFLCLKEGEEAEIRATGPGTFESERTSRGRRISVQLRK